MMVDPLFDNLGFLQSTLAHAEQGREPAVRILENGASAELWANGVLCIEPVNSDSSTKSVLLSCGIHGNETAPIELLDRLIADILAGQVDVRHRVLFIFGNPGAAIEQQRFCDENLNRLFAGKHGQTPANLETQLAAQIEAHTERFFKSAGPARLHYDLHTAIRGSKFKKFAVYPYREDQAWSRSQLAFLERCGVKAVLLFHQASTTYSYYTSSEFAAHAFTIELGSVRPFGENDLNQFTLLREQLLALLDGSLVITQQPEHLRLFSVVEEVIKRSDNMRFSFADSVENFTAYTRGDVLVEDLDYQYVVTGEEERIVFPHQMVPVGQRALLVVEPARLNASKGS